MLPQHRTLHPLQCCSVVAGDTNACVCVRSRTRVFTHGLAHAFATAGSMSRVVYIWIILRVSTPRAKYLSCTERYLWFNSVTLPRPRISLSDSRRRAFIHARESRRMRVEMLIKYKPGARRSISHSECETLNLKKKTWCLYAKTAWPSTLRWDLSYIAMRFIRSCELPRSWEIRGSRYQVLIEFQVELVE